MKLEIEVFRRISDRVAQDIYSLSLLMEEVNEGRYSVFPVTHVLVENKIGNFFIVKYKKKKVAFGCFSYGDVDPKHRRLNYFAVKKHWRGKGVGGKAIKMALDMELSSGAICSVSCPLSLKIFYEKIGFVYYSTSVKDNFDNKEDEVTLVYSKTVKDPREYDISTYAIQMTHEKVFPTLKLYDDKYQLDLLATYNERVSL